MNDIDNIEMLVSILNMKLRDHYASLEELVDDLGLNEQVLLERLAQVGYQYDLEHHRFIEVEDAS